MRLINWFFSAVIVLPALSPCAQAGPVVFVFDKPGNFLDHRYELQVDADGKEVLGVIVINAFTIFNVTGASPIAAPDNWGFIPPIDPDSDGLFYFATTAEADIQMNKSKRGFFFESMQPLVPFKVGLVLLDGTAEVTAIAPEPSSVLLIACGLAAVAVWRRRRLFTRA